MAGESAAPTLWSVRELLNWTTRFFSEKGIDSPRLDAQLLLAHVLSCSRIELIARSDELPGPQQRSQYREFVRRRAEGCPVAYLTGHREFYLLNFEVSPAVLIPRPDTETLVAAAIPRLRAKSAGKALDLGTGSGCIAITLAHQCPQAQVTAIDVSPDALEIATRNSRKHGVADRVHWLRGDLFAPLTAEARFDLIVSNPPYVTAAEYAELASEVREHEPRLALDGGTDGLIFYRRIAAEAAEHLEPGGYVLVEIGWQQQDAVTQLFAEQAAWTGIRAMKDAGGRPRVVEARKA